MLKISRNKTYMVELDFIENCLVCRFWSLFCAVDYFCLSPVETEPPLRMSNPYLLNKQITAFIFTVKSKYNKVKVNRRNIYFVISFNQVNYNTHNTTIIIKQIKEGNIANWRDA